MTRKEILAAALADINRMDKVDLLPVWLRSAEQHINETLRADKMVSRSRLYLTETLFPLPDDFLAFQSMLVLNPAGEKAGSLYYVPADQADEKIDVLQCDTPTWFSRRGEYMELVGWTPKSFDFQLELFYYARLPRLNNDDDTNWLAEYAPQVYTDAVAHFGYAHLQEAQNAQLMLSKVDQEISRMNARDRENAHGSGPLIQRRQSKIGGRFS